MRLATWNVTSLRSRIGRVEEFLQRHVRPEYARRLRAEKKAGGSGWETIKWKQHLFENMSIEIARANYRMMMERTLPPMAA